jgi:serine/threonine-protein kinase
VLDGRWRLVRKIAEGAMGSVHEAESTLGPGPRVAVKLLKTELGADEAIRRRFRREASVLQALAHPGVVRVLEVGEDGAATAYTVMELLTGETLEARMARDPKMSPPALRPLAAVHRHGVIHGDLKPANVFLPTGGAFPVKLVDFGLSKIEGLERLTRTGELTGTPAYMAPELLTGRGEIDHRIDLYALGVIAYEALAGKLPFATNRHPGALMMDIVTGKAAPLTELRPDVHPAIAQAIARAMAPKRELRPADAGQLWVELRAAFAAGSSDP